MRRPAVISPIRIRWPFALLLVSLGLTTFAVFDAQRAERSNQSLATRAVEDYASFAGWSYAEHLEEAMRTTAREALGAVNHGASLHTAPNVPAASDLPQYLPYFQTCTCYRPVYGPIAETFFAMRMGESRLQSATNTHAMPAEGWEVDAPMRMPMPSGTFAGYADADARAIVSKVTFLVRTIPDPEHGYRYFILPLSIGPRMLVYTLMPTVRGDTMVYGVQYSPDAIRNGLRDVYNDEALLPDAIVAGRRNRDLIDVAVTDSSGQPLFESADEHRDLVAHIKLPVQFASLEVQAGIRPNEAGSLIVGGLPGSRLPFLLGILAIAAGLTVVAVMQLRREAELAGMRANWISSVSHELRTPLAQIRLYLDTVRLGRAEDPVQREWALSHVDRETTRLHHLVENVLRFSQVGKSTGALPRPIDLSAEARHIIDEFRPLAASRNVTIDANIGVTKPVALRPYALRHVLLNLLDNAVKYGPDGQTVTVGVEQTNGVARISVSDQGRGIPGSERDSIWRPFTRGASGRDMTGSGIGLSIVHDVATEHGGRAWVDVAPGGGARFTVTLPVAAADA